MHEGAANVVYRLHIPSVLQHPPSPSTDADLHSAPGATPGSTTPPPSLVTPPRELDDPYAPFRGQLLRLHKQVDWIASSQSLQEQQSRLIAPLFSELQLVNQRLVLLPDGLLSSLSDALMTDAARQEKRRGVPLAVGEKFGMLVTDMSPRRSANEVLIEVKPKWLAQSPNAPEDATRCRTCALRSMRSQKEPSATNAVAHTTGFCPLDLVWRDSSDVAMAVHNIVAHSSDTKNLDEKAQSTVARKLEAYFLQSSLLVRLRDVQLDKDPAGILASATTDTPLEAFLVATTLRDCTLFLRLTTLEDGAHGDGVEARLGDLDLKAPEPSKLEHWRKTERKLIQEGWYGGRKAEQHEIEICRLGRTNSAGEKVKATQTA